MVGWWLIFLGAHSDFGSTTTHTKALNPQVLLYFSGTSLLTIGFGDVVATSNFTRGLALAEAFTGLATLALVISYLPALYGAYNRREALIFTLDRVHAPTERTGAIEVLPLLESFENYQELREFFIRWEYWIAELMESHVSFPVLAYFRSQNEERSWLAALALVLNLSTLLLAVDPSTDSKAPYWLYRRGVQALREILVQLHLPPRNTDLDASVVEARQSLLAQRESYFQKTLYPVLRGHARDPGSVVGATVAWESVERFRGDYWPQVETLRHYLRFQANIFARRLD